MKIVDKPKFHSRLIAAWFLIWTAIGSWVAVTSGTLVGFGIGSMCAVVFACLCVEFALARTRWDRSGS